MNPIYKFYINSREVMPNYKDDLTLDYELESGQRFYRSKLSGKLTFQTTDFDWLNLQPFDTEFIFTIQKSDDRGQTWSEYWKGVFYKTDCQWNIDDKKCIVQPNRLDQYNNVLAGLEKEYNLIELAPEIERITIQKRPLIQIYKSGDNVLSCYLSGSYWEQDCDIVTDKNKLTKLSTDGGYNFAITNYLKEIEITVNGTPSEASGTYTGSLTISGSNSFSGILTKFGNPEYKIEIMQTVVNNWIYSVDVSLIKGNTTLFVYNNANIDFDFDNLDFTMNAVAGSGATGTATAEMTSYAIFMRYLLNTNKILGKDTYPVPQEDITDNNLNYNYVIGYNFDLARINPRTNTTPTEWGRRQDGNYYTMYYVIGSRQLYPIARSSWRQSSIWFLPYIFDDIYEKAGRSPFILRDSYTLSSAIKRLLQQFAPQISHEETAEYSQFLYANQNPISEQIFKLLITQKSNISRGQYDRPAQKAPTTLQQILNMLRDTFRCYWYIDDNKLKIEHISWFKNGGSYSNSPQISYDLTTLENTRNLKKWGYLTSSFEFDKVDMPERYEFKWMDDCTRSFEGFPIEVKSKYVTAGKIENINVSGFTSDIDYMLLNPTSINNDGFVIFAAKKENIYNLQDVRGGIIRADGTIAVGNNLTQYGFNWAHIKMNCEGGKSYSLISSSSGNVINFVYWHFFDSQGNSLGEASGVSGTVITPDGATTLGLSWQTEQIANPSRGLYYNDWFTRFYQVQELNYSLPFVEREVNNQLTVMQNGYLAFITLHPNFWTYDLPAKNVLINKERAYVQGIERKKKQNLSFPITNDPDPLKLIKTPLGNGQCDKFSINLHSRNCKSTLKYDTE